MTPADSITVAASELDLRRRLEEVEEVLRAIRSGEADGIVVSGPNGDQIYTLQGAEHPYRLFVEAMSQGAFTMTVDGMILFCNRTFSELVNLPVDAVVGQGIDTIPLPALRSCITAFLHRGHVEGPVSAQVCERERTLDVVLNKNAGDGNIAVLVTDVTDLKAGEATLRSANEQMEARILNRTAEMAQTVEELRAARLAAVNMMQDAVEAAQALEDANRDLTLQIAERKKSDEANRRLATVVEQSAESIVVTDLEGTIVYVNPAFERITGYTSDEVIGQNPRILKSGKQPLEFYQRLWATIGSGDVWQGHFVNRRKDGSLYEEEAAISPVRDASGSLVNYVAIKRDVSTEVALAEQLRHTQKIEAIGTLAGGVAHDFNNLLQAMLSIVQLLKKRSAENPRVLEPLKQLEETVRRGAGLTRQLLLFARRETSKRENLDLNEVVRDLFKFLRRIVRENIGLNVETAELPLRIHADRGQIEQVVMNLAVNAVDAMPDGGVLSIATGFENDSAWLTVSDTGHGIPDAIRDRIFEPFFTTKEVGKGTGLGLSVVHGIILAHGGHIELESPADRGATFKVQLPLQTAPATLKPQTPSERDVPDGRGERVLLVEDDAIAREGILGILESIGYSAQAFGTGEDVFARSDLTPCALVLTDLVLPGMSGLEVIRRLRAQWPDVKAILMSGYVAPGLIDSRNPAEEFQFLHKPFDVADLASTLCAALQGSVATLVTQG